MTTKPMLPLYLVSNASRNIMYVLPTENVRDEMLQILKEEFPLQTFYIGKTDKYSGAVYWDKPEFPKGKTR